MHTLELATALHQAGHTVCVYALDKDGTGFDRSLAFEVKLIPALPVIGDIDILIQQRINELVYFFAHDLQAKYDIFHAQDCIGANALWILRQQGLIPHFVRTVHHIEDYTSPYLQQCQEQSIREPDLCLCVSDYWQQQLRQHYQIQAGRVINGVNCHRFQANASAQAAMRAQIGISGAPVYLTVGGIEPRKNTIGLLRAFAQVQALYPQAQLVIAGGATLFDYQPYRHAFFSQVEQLQLTVGESLLLPGVIADADLPALYRCADSFVFPSLKEGWGLVVLEAIASDLPTIVSNAAPFTEFLTPEQALFVEPEDISAIAAAMLACVQPNLRQALVQTSQSVLTTYSWATSAQMHIQHYSTLLAETRMI